MPDPETPRLYLVTGDRIGPDDLAALLERMLAAAPVACVRLDLGTAGEEEWIRAANLVLPICHAAEVPLLVAEHHGLVGRLGLDGVHVADARVPLRALRRDLGPDRIIGAFAGASRHDGMTLAEAGADYVALGPVGARGALGSAAPAPDELFAWWSEMIETPVVAEGAVSPADVARLEAQADFFVPDRAIWADPDPVARLGDYAAALAG